jgi:hypothetical protein
MTSLRLSTLGLAVVLAWPAASLQAQLNRSAVSVTGDDANACTPAAPCRTFNRAISQTNTGGEVLALTSGGYGPFEVSRSMTIQAAPGVYAGVTATGGSIAVRVLTTAGSLVVLRGLTLEGLGTGDTGIFQPNGNAGELVVDRCVVAGFAGSIVTSYGLTLTDTVVRDYFSYGVLIAGSGEGTLDGLRTSNESGVAGSQSVLSVAVATHSSAHVTARNVSAVSRGGRDGAAFLALGGSLNLEHVITSNFEWGVLAAGGAVRASNVTATAGGYGFANSPGSPVIESFGNNKLVGNQVAVQVAPALVAMQ